MAIRLESRIGPDPHADPRDPRTPNADGCPDVWRLNNGDYAVIGLDITASVDQPLPETAGCGYDERIVLVPRRILEAAARDLTS